MSYQERAAEFFEQFENKPYLGPIEGLVVSVDPLLISILGGAAFFDETKLSELEYLQSGFSRTYSVAGNLVTSAETDEVNDGGDQANTHKHIVDVNSPFESTGTITFTNGFMLNDVLLLLPIMSHQSFYILGKLKSKA